MTDRELLEKAAKAAGIEAKFYETGDMVGCLALIDGCRRQWAPLSNHGDALRLAIELQLSIMVLHDQSQPLPWLRIEDQEGRWTHAMTGEYKADPSAATCRAIVCAAAEIGKAMP